MPPDHDPVEQTHDPDGRIHVGPDSGDVYVDMDDPDGFGYSVAGHYLMPIGGKPDTLILELQRLGQGAFAAAAWLQQTTKAPNVNPQSDPEEAPIMPREGSLSTPTLALTPCPSWCEFGPDHRWGGDFDANVRRHLLTFGDDVTITAIEYQGGPGQLSEYGVELTGTADGQTVGPPPPSPPSHVER